MTAARDRRTNLACEHRGIYAVNQFAVIDGDDVWREDTQPRINRSNALGNASKPPRDFVEFVRRGSASTNRIHEQYIVFVRQPFSDVVAIKTCLPVPFRVRKDEDGFVTQHRLLRKQRGAKGTWLAGVHCYKFQGVYP